MKRLNIPLPQATRTSPKLGKSRRARILRVSLRVLAAGFATFLALAGISWVESRPNPTITVPLDWRPTIPPQKILPEVPPHNLPKEQRA